MTGLVVFKNKVVVGAVPSPCAVSAANGAALVRLQLLLSHGFHQQCGLVARQRHGPSGGKHESHVPHDTSCMEARNPSNVIFLTRLTFLHRRNRLPETISAMCGSRRGDEYLFADLRTEDCQADWQ